MLFDLIAAYHNEGIHKDMLRKYLPKTASRDFNELLDKFGPEIYRDAIWNERAQASKPPEKRCVIGWPIKRISNIIPLRVYQRTPVAAEYATFTIQEIPGGFWNP